MFPEIGSTASDVLISAKLTSANDLDGGVFIGATDKTYTKNGVLLQDASDGINWEASVTAAQKAELVKAGTMTLEVESALVTDGYTGVGEGILGGYGTSFFYIEMSNADNKPRVRVNSSFSTKSRLKNIGKGSHIRIDMTWIGNKVTVYFDYLPLIQFSAALASDQFDNFLGVGTSHVGKAPLNHRVRNFQLSTKPIILPTKYGLENICMFGHSYADNGDYSSGSFTDLNGDKGNGDTGDALTLPEIHRLLGERNLGVGNGQIRNYGVGGEKVVGGAGDLGAQIASAIAVEGLIKVAMLQFGTNEVIQSANDWETDYGASGGEYDFETDYQTEITSLINNGAEIILLANVVSVVNDSTYNSQTYKDRVDACNVMIDSLVAANSQVYLVDLFSEFGGHDITSSDFVSDDYHPISTGTGYKRIGERFFDRLMDVL